MDSVEAEALVAFLTSNTVEQAAQLLEEEALDRLVILAHSPVVVSLASASLGRRVRRILPGAPTLSEGHVDEH